MAYTTEIYEAVREVYAERRKRSEARLSAAKARIYGLCPRLAEIEAEMKAGAGIIINGIIKGIPLDKKIKELEGLIKALQNERARLLKELGESEYALEPGFECADCGDTGYIGDRACPCLERELRQAAYSRSTLGKALAGQTFDSFKLSFYPQTNDENGINPREHMKRILKHCREFVQNFGQNSDSMLFSGRTGLGKTHMASAIAGELIKTGRYVRYVTAPDMFSVLEKEKFGRGEQEDDTDFFSCDLLIIDDLGSEFTTPFNISALFSVLNGRIIRSKPTIITTNSAISDLHERYGEKIVSRILGEFMLLTFSGKDIRAQKKKVDAE